MRIVVAGGTGRIGARLVEHLAGHDVVVAAPSTGIDASTGQGLDAALRGADAVVDVTRPHTYDPEGVRAFFTAVTTNLLRAERDAGVRHHVALTIVGTDDHTDAPFYRAKAEQEQLVRASGVPYSLAHATQFFEFATGIADASVVDGVVRVADARVQPIAAHDVASELTRVVLGDVAVGDVEVAGPDAMPLESFVRRALRAQGDEREVVADPEALYFGGRVGADALLPGPDARIGATHFADWLTRPGR